MHFTGQRSPMNKDPLRQKWILHVKTQTYSALRSDCLNARC